MYTDYLPLSNHNNKMQTTKDELKENLEILTQYFKKWRDCN